MFISSFIPFLFLFFIGFFINIQSLCLCWLFMFMLIFHVYVDFLCLCWLFMFIWTFRVYVDITCLYWLFMFMLIFHVYTDFSCLYRFFMLMLNYNFLRGNQYVSDLLSHRIAFSMLSLSCTLSKVWEMRRGESTAQHNRSEGIWWAHQMKSRVEWSGVE